MKADTKLIQCTNCQYIDTAHNFKEQIFTPTGSEMWDVCPKCRAANKTRKVKKDKSLQ